jgi:phosphoesterase RecJ-like protein
MKKNPMSNLPKLTHRQRDKIIRQILSAVKKGKTFLLSGHRNPDGDTVGSEVAFSSLLRRLGKRVDMINLEPVPPALLFLPGARQIRSMQKVAKNYDVVIVFECSGADRMGNILDLDHQAKVVINIDHHAHHNFFGDINLIDAHASSNSEQLFRIFELARLPLTRNEAAALYVGMVTDTGRFQQDNTNPDSYRIAGQLLAAGAPVAEISRQLYATRSEAALKLLARALASLRLTEKGRVAVLKLSAQDFAETSTTLNDTEEIVNYGLMVPSVEAVVFLKEDTKSILMSFRGKGSVDLCRVAVDLGGGGHRNASGCALKGSLSEVEQRVLKTLRLHLP